MKLLTFKELSEKNLLRCNSSFHNINEWTLTDWACALAGETGEACNLIKKVRRGDDKITVKDIGSELADIVIYADLLSQRIGIDLGEEIREKFNIVSDRVDSKIKL